MQGGSEFAGRYLLDRRLGRGSFGEVWAARDRLQTRQVAIKFLYRHIAESDPVWLSKFKQEARIAVRLKHPGIVSVDDFGEYDGQWYLVMEFLEGHDLADEIASSPHGLPVVRAVSIASQIAEALAAAAEHGVVHRDLKPGNVMLLEGDRVKICDFGIARLVDASTNNTLHGRQIGTPAYMAPEQWLAGQIDHRADLYALGGIMHALLLGRPPFSGPSVNELMGQHLNAVPTSLRELRPEIPEHLNTLVLDLLAKDPAQRPADATTALNRLSHARPAPHPQEGRPGPDDQDWRRDAAKGDADAMGNLGWLLHTSGRVQEAE
ncbi:serine/threonine-protein kinase, partial [Streptosporangium canum]|uniref:serine/threonine-protein kinase n=1 Tax=Streptosporangium canum TaxID=324952 RepID=UPI00342F1BEB